MDATHYAASPLSFMRRFWSVVRAWTQAPLQVATICPSSPFLTSEIADRDCIRDAARVVELGPGAGGTTHALLSRMRPDARLLAIEKTRQFEPVLTQITDPRLEIRFGDATDLNQIATECQFGPADVVVSGIPFSALPTTSARRIVESVHDLLRVGGVFIAYQMRDDIQFYAHDLFGQPERGSVPLNLPPLSIFTWTKAVQHPAAA